MHRTLPPYIAPLVVSTILLVIVAGGWRAVDARERHNHPHAVMTRQFCLKCHNSPQWIAKIAAKEGKLPTDQLFPDDPVHQSAEARRFIRGQE